MSQTESVDPLNYKGINLEEWERVFSPHIIEFPASRFAYTTENQDQVRIAFGNRGPFTDTEGNRNSPRYTHAVTMSQDLVLEFARLILSRFAQVDKPKS